MTELPPSAEESQYDQSVLGQENVKHMTEPEPNGGGEKHLTKCNG